MREAEPEARLELTLEVERGQLAHRAAVVVARPAPLLVVECRKCCTRAGSPGCRRAERCRPSTPMAAWRLVRVPEAACRDAAAWATARARRGSAAWPRAESERG